MRDEQLSDEELWDKYHGPDAEKDTPPSVRSDDLLAVYIPADLQETFSDFVTMACAAIDGTSRSEWTDDERRIFEWMQKGKYKNQAEKGAKKR